MIQRVQTIYLAIVVGLICGFLYLPVAGFVSSNASVYLLKISSFTKANDAVDILAGDKIVQGLAWVLLAVDFLSVFLFKKRKWQMNLCRLSVLFLVILDFLAFIVIHYHKINTGAIVHYRVAILFPLIGSVLSYLAFRGIKKDDQLVKSYDRLR